jgi:hypothetical protein
MCAASASTFIGSFSDDVSLGILATTEEPFRKLEAALGLAIFVAIGPHFHRKVFQGGGVAQGLTQHLQG